MPVSLRVGLFGLIGSGNSGNDASMETVLAYLRTAHPEVVVDAMCGGPELVRARYGIAAVPTFWYQKFEQRKTAVPAPLLKAYGKGIDAFRTARWVSRHDAVIVPGAGAFETTLPVHAWGFPSALFVLSLSGKMFGTKVALVSVGADEIGKRVTRWLSNSTARLASYRSYRDSFSWDAMRQRGVDTSADPVYPDLVFGVPVPSYAPGDPRLVGVGVMAYRGGNDDRQQADRIHAAYTESVTRFIRWLIDGGYRVRLFGGDAKFDIDVAEQIAADVRSQSPAADDSALEVAPAASYAELMQAMAPCGIVVATRYHNVMCALKLCKPTISLGYSRKFVALMESMGLTEFTLSANSPDVDELVALFKETENRQAELRERLAARNAANRQSLDDQFAVLSALLFPGRTPATDPPRGEFAGAPGPGDPVELTAGIAAASLPLPAYFRHLAPECRTRESLNARPSVK
jgi:polysaccharide pyruvyl transferase WcaK-like protein